MRKKTLVMLTSVVLSMLLVSIPVIPAGAVTITINGCGSSCNGTTGQTLSNDLIFGGQPTVTYPDGTVVPIERFSGENSGGQQEEAPDDTLPAVEEDDAASVQNAAVTIPGVADSSTMAAFRAAFDNSPAQALVARAIWYMKYGYMVYGHTKYAATGYIDCSNFVSLVYKDFGYTITSAARKYDTVGRSVAGVYSKNQAGSTKKYMLVGIDKLKPGDIMTFWKEDSSGNRYIGHVAIYMGKLNGKPAIIQTCSGNPTAIGITTSFTYWYGQHFAGARRVLPSNAYAAGAAYQDIGPVIPTTYKMTHGPVIMPKNLPQGF